MYKVELSCVELKMDTRHAEYYTPRFPIEWQGPIREHLRNVALLRDDRPGLVAIFDNIGAMLRLVTLDKGASCDTNKVHVELYTQSRCLNYDTSCNITSFPTELYVDGCYKYSNVSYRYRHDLPHDKTTCGFEYKKGNFYYRVGGPSCESDNGCSWHKRNQYHRYKYCSTICFRVCRYEIDIYCDSCILSVQ